MGIGSLIPKLATTVPKYKYDDQKQVLAFKIGEIFVRMEPRLIKVSGVKSLEDGAAILAQVKQMIYRVLEHHDGE